LLKGKKTIIAHEKKNIFYFILFVNKIKYKFTRTGFGSTFLKGGFFAPLFPKVEKKWIR
jgi:hypothetical protein